MVKHIHLTYEGKIFSKKNSKQIVMNRRTNKPTIISNKNVRTMESDMVGQFRKQAYEEGWQVTKAVKLDGEEPKKFAVCVEIYEESLRRHDLDNQLTSLLDGLVDALVLPDDSFDYVPHLEVNYGGLDRENPRAEIDIWELEE